LSSQANFIRTDSKALENAENGTMVSGELCGYAANKKEWSGTLLK
jgi:hypothetical protein